MSTTMFIILLVIFIIMMRNSQENEGNNNRSKTNKNCLVCPDCGSVHVDILDNTKKGFSLGKTVGGTVIAGPLGGLAGFTGKKNKRPKMRCLDCGWVFEYKL